MEQEGRGHTSHHRCNWNSRQEHQEGMLEEYQAAITSTACRDQQF